MFVIVCTNSAGDIEDVIGLFGDSFSAQTWSDKHPPTLEGKHVITSFAEVSARRKAAVGLSHGDGFW
jgi:hypothetical protein